MLHLAYVNLLSNACSNWRLVVNLSLLKPKPHQSQPLNSGASKALLTI